MRPNLEALARSSLKASEILMKATPAALVVAAEGL